MNRYTWSVAPQGRKSIKIKTFGDTHDEAQAAAKEIVRDVWKPLFEQEPNREIVGELVQVEQVDSPLTVEQVFVGG